MKKKNLMRSLALCLCLCLCFAACSGTGGSSSTARPASSSGGGAEPAVQGNSITFPLAEAKEFSLMVSCSYTGDPNDLVINQRIAEDTNVNINWVDLGTGTERLEKLKLLLNSGDYGDGCCFSKRMRKVFRKNEKNMLQNCNKKAKRKGRLQRVKKPM